MPANRVSFIASWIVLAALYLACVGSISPDEAAVGVVVGLLTAIWVWRIRQQRKAKLIVRLDMLRPLMEAMARLPIATVKVGKRLLKLVADPTNAGATYSTNPADPAVNLSETDPEMAGRRAVFVLATSLTPDAYVLLLGGDADPCLLHTIEPARSTR